MPTIEQRLKALEKRARTDDERWQMLDAQTKAIRCIFHCIGAPIIADHPELGRKIIKNLRTYEKAARTQNEHSVAIREYRKMREFFSERI